MEEEPDSATSGSQDSEGEALDGDSRKPSRYKLSLDKLIRDGDWGEELLTKMAA